jgi:hypothetical protein
MFPHAEDRLMDSSRVPGWLYWACGLLLLVPLWLPAYLPTEDGPAHLYWVEVYRALGDPGDPLNQFFARNINWSTPFELAQFGLQYGLASVLEPHLAQKVLATLVALSWVGAICFASFSLRGQITLGAFTALLLVHSAWLYGGFFAFLGAVPIIIVTLGLLARTRRQPGRLPVLSYITIALLGVIAYFAHIFVAALFVLLCGLWLVIGERGMWVRKMAVALTVLPTAGLLAWYLLHGTVGGETVYWEPVSFAAARFFGLAFFRGLGAPEIAFWAALALMGVLLAMLCWTAVRAIWLGYEEARSPVIRFVLILAAVSAILFFAAPERVGKAGNFNGRIQFAMWAWLLPVLPLRLPQRLRPFALGAVCTLLAWQLAAFSLRALRFNRDYSAVIADAAAISPGATLRSMLRYENARYEGSFIRILAHTPEDIAFRRRAILLNSFFPPLGFYWVTPRPGLAARPDLLLDIQQRPGQKASLVLTPNPEGGVAGAAPEVDREGPHAR